METLVVVCAWCVAEKKIEKPKDPRVSHGICREHAEKMREENRLRLAREKGVKA